VPNRFGQVLREKVKSWGLCCAAFNGTKEPAMDEVIEKVAISVEEASKRASLGRSFLWNAVLSGELTSYRLGRRRLVRVADLDEWIRSHKAAPRATAPKP
jgi:excisionase family DNA binding protein